MMVLGITVKEALLCVLFAFLYVAPIGTLLLLNALGIIR